MSSSNWCFKVAGRNINNLRYADDTTLIAESEEELKSLLMKVKEESEKVGLNTITSSRVGGACQDKAPSRDSQAAWLSKQL